MSDVYIGIDVHQNQSFYCAMNEQGKCLDHQNISTTEMAFKDLVSKYRDYSVVHVALETGGSSWWVSDVLKKNGVDVYPVNPRELKLVAHSKRKTDKYDSRVLADLLRCNGLPERVYIPEKEILRLRNALRIRKWLVRQRSQSITRAKAVMRQIGIKMSSQTFHTEKSWKNIFHQHAEWMWLLEPIHKIWQEAGSQLDTTERTLCTMLPVNDGRMRLLMSIPGVGPVTAWTFIASIVDPNRFHKADQVVSYAGMVPSEDSSGERQRMGSITKRGRSDLRDSYVQAAWALLRSRDSRTANLKKFFYRIMQRRCSQVAIIALAKKLLIISYSLVSGC